MICQPNHAGEGLFIYAHLFPTGDVVGEYTGERISVEEAAGRQRAYEGVYPDALFHVYTGSKVTTV